MGHSYRAIGEALGVSAGRAREIAKAGRALVDPDEVVFPPNLVPATPTRFLPVDRITREALADMGLGTFGEVLGMEPAKLRSVLLRYPNLGRSKLEELERLVTAVAFTSVRVAAQ